MPATERHAQARRQVEMKSFWNQTRRQSLVFGTLISVVGAGLLYIIEIDTQVPSSSDSKTLKDSGRRDARDAFNRLEDRRRLRDHRRFFRIFWLNANCEFGMVA